MNFIAEDRRDKRKKKLAAITVLTITAVVLNTLLNGLFTARAATYTWVQEDWSGGQTANYPNHDSNRTGWDEYSAKDSTTSAGSTVVTTTESASTTDTSSTDFGNGTTSSTEVFGSGDDARVRLTGTEVSEPLIGSLKYIAFDSSTNSVWVTGYTASTVTKISAADKTVTGTYSVGTGPYGVTFDSSTNSVWVANYGSGNVTKLAASNGSVVGTYSVGGNPWGVAFDSSTNSIWVANRASNTVTKLAASDGSTTGTYSVGNQPHGVAFDSSTNSIWVANYNSDTVTKLVASDGSVTGTYRIGDAPKGVAFDSSTNSIWVANENSGTISKLSAATGLESTAYAANDAIDAVYDPSTDSVWVVNNVSPGTISKYPAGGTTASGTYSTGGNGPSRAAYDSSTNSIWVANTGSDTVTKLSAADGSTTGTYSVGDYPIDITFDSSTNSIWVANFYGGFGDNTVTKLSAADGSTTGTYTVGKYPRGITFDSSTNSIWTANDNDETVTKLSAADGSTTGTYSVESGLSDVIFDSTTNSIWTTNSYKAQKLSAADGSVTGTYDIGKVNWDIIFDSATDSVWFYNSSAYTLDQADVTDGSEENRYQVGYQNNSRRSGFAFDSSSYSIWGTADDTNIISKIPLYTYPSSGTFTRIIDTTANTGYGEVSWNAVTLTNTTLTVKVRTSNDSGMAGATAWGSCNAITSGNDISSNNCVTDGHRYIEYQLSMATTDDNLSPLVDDITINYDQYSASSTLTSSAYNSTDAANTLASIAWSETTPAGTDVKFQMRTAPDDSSSPGTWTDWLGPTSTSDYYTDSSGGDTLHSSHRDSTNDQWVQYKAFLTSTGASTATLSSVTITYVVNAVPEFEGGQTTASQGSDTMVTISYSIRDTDTTSGSTTPNYVTPTFEYSLNGGGAWNDVNLSDITFAAAPTGGEVVDDNSDSKLDNKVLEGDYLTYTAYWDADSQITANYSATTQIRVTINDNEAANNTATSTTSNFTLDTTDPVPTVTYNSMTDTLTISATDDTMTGLQMKFSNESDLSADGTNADSGNWIDYATSKSWTGTGNPETIYYQFRDAYGNVSAAGATSSVVTPATPSNPIYQDISNTETSEWREFIAWGAVAEPTPGFKRYNIYRSTNGTDYSLLTTKTDRSTNYHMDTGLSTDTTYYYKISAEDDDDNISNYSSVVSDQPDGQGGTDLTSPTISSVSIGSITTQGATVTWDTDEPSNSSVEYITATGGDFTGAPSTGSSIIADTASGLGQHSVTLTGLSANTTYYLQVKSTDPSDNTGSSKDGVNGYSFTTLDGPSISSVSASSVSNTGVTVIWNTDVNSNSYVVYSVNSDMSSSTETGTDDSVTSHSVDISGLTAGQTYYFYVKSGVAQDTNGGDYYTFNTTSDASGPTITFDSTTDISNITATSARISWTTDELATSAVNYGTTTAYGSQSTSSNLNTDHHLNISGLTANTTYYFKISSTDESSNTTTDDNTGSSYSFTTSTSGPSMSSVASSNITYNSATITWTTAENSNSLVDYGTTTSYGDRHGKHGDATTSHSVTLPNLAASTGYSYRVLSTDSSNNTSTDDNSGSGYTFTTLSGSDDADGDGEGDHLTDIADEINEMIDSGEFTEEEIQEAIADIYSSFKISTSGPSAKVEDNTNVKITWNTNRNSTGRVVYWKDTDKESTATTVSEGRGYVTKHEVLIKNLDAQTKYKYYVVSTSRLGAEATSDEKTFTTDDSPQIASISVTDVTVDSAVVNWESDSVSSFTVEYGTDTSYGSEVNATGGTDNTYSATISSLVSGREYHVRIVGTDDDDETVTSDDYSFSTPAIPTISGARVEQIETEKAVVKWNTSSNTDSLVEYKIAGSEKGDSQGKLEAVTQHEITIEKLTPGGRYEVIVVSKDQFSNEAKSEPFFFTAGEDSGPPVPRNIKSETTVFPGKDSKIQAVVSWNTDKSANSIMAYKEGNKAQEDVDWGQIFQNKDLTTFSDWTIKRKDPLTTNHIFIVPDFKPNTIYQIKAAGVDRQGNIATSKNYSTLTPAKGKSIFDMIVDNFEETFGWIRKIRN